MRRAFQITAFLRAFAAGIITPVLALALMTHGASITTLSLLLGAYSFSVITMEIPSGIFADLYGRKKATLLSTVLGVVSYCLMLASNAVPLLLVSMVAQGLSRAFSSGSIDSWAIDDAVAGGGSIPKVTSQLAIIDSVGLAAGALTGGWLSRIGSRYEVNILSSMFIYVMLLFTVLFIRENRPLCDIPRERRFDRIGLQVKESFAFARQKGLVRILFISAFLTGLALLSVETYWQPAVSLISSESWLLGLVSFAGFFFVILGSKAAQHLLTKKAAGGIAWLLAGKALLGISLVVLRFQMNVTSFIGVYALAYFFTGGSGVAENALLNETLAPGLRASVLSLFSFVLQAGGLASSLLGYAVSANMDFRNMWVISGALLTLTAGAFALISTRARPAEVSVESPERLKRSS